MKTLTINQKVFKHQDTQTKLKIALFEDNNRVSLDSNADYQFKIKNSSGYLKSETLTIEDDRLVLTTDKFKDLTPDAYSFEVWENEDSIYPSENYGYFKITKNVSEIDGEVIPVITIEDFEKRFDEAVKNAKGDKGDTGLQGEKGEKGDTGERGADGADGKSAYQVWLELGNSGSEQDFINSLKPKVERHAPMGCTLDTSTKPWTVWFDNGCGLQIPSYWNNSSVYSTANWFDFRFDGLAMPATIMRASLGGKLFIEDLKNNRNPIGATYWDENAKVLNPIRNDSDYDWSKAYLNEATAKEGDSNFAFRRNHIVIKLMYQLGVWDGSTVESFGAVRK